MKIKLIAFATALLAAGCAPPVRRRYYQGRRAHESRFKEPGRPRSTASTRTTCSAFLEHGPPVPKTGRADREGAARDHQVPRRQYLATGSRRAIAQSASGQYNDDPKRPAAPTLRLPPAHEGGGLLRDDRPEPAQLAKLPATARHPEVRLEQGLQLARLRRLLQHAAVRVPGILTEQQIKDVVALLMDPNSPVTNRVGWPFHPPGAVPTRPFFIEEH